MTGTSPCPPVSIIIPTLNEERYLPYLLDSLLYLENIEVIVVDAGSEDQTAAVVASYVDRFAQGNSLRFVMGERGISRQRNLGARMAQYPTLLFLDADVVMPSPEVFNTLVTEFVAGDHGIANPRFTPHPLDVHSRFFWVYDLIFAMQRTSIRMHRPLFSGACLITHREVFETVGGFDENLLLSEDTDYAWKVIRHKTCGLIDIKIPNSTRRLKKLGVRDAIPVLRAIPSLFQHGRMSNSVAAHYGFGDHTPTRS